MIEDHINEQIKDFVALGYSIRRISTEVSKSYTSVRYRLKVLGLKTLSSPELVMQNRSRGSLDCTVCGTQLTGLQTKFCSDRCKGRSPSAKHQTYSAQKRRALARKQELVIRLGGKCEVCGYAKNLAALCFHHRNSGDKSFPLDARSLSAKSPQSIAKEAAKCQLLCMNCHTEIHNPCMNKDLGTQSFKSAALTN